MTYIFIIGQHRTGSTLLKNIFDTNSEVTMAFDEMNLFEPYRKNTLDKFFKRTEVTPNQIITLIKERKIYGTFWQEFEKSGIKLENLKEHLDKNTLINSSSVLTVILQLLRIKNNTRLSGVKYPIHFRRIEYIFENWPESKVVFLTRNPQAIIASKLNDTATRKRKAKSLFHRLFIHYFTLLYSSIEYGYSIKSFFKYKKQLKLVTYEKLVSNQRETIIDLCNWIGLSFEKKMLDVSGKPSSHFSYDKNVVHVGSIDKYKDILTSFDSYFISLLTDSSYKKIKDELSTNF